MPLETCADVAREARAIRRELQDAPHGGRAAARARAKKAALIRKAEAKGLGRCLPVRWGGDGRER